MSLAVNMRNQRAALKAEVGTTCVRDIHVTFCMFSTL